MSRSDKRKLSQRSRSLLSVNQGVVSAVYCVALSLMNVYWYMDMVPVLSGVLKVIEFIAVGTFLLLYVLQLKTYDKRALVKSVLLLAFGACVYYFSRNSIAFIFIMMILSVKNVKVDSLVKTDMYVKMALIVVLGILSSLGLTNDVPIQRDGVSRYSFGFYHPNGFGEVLANIWIDFVYLYRDRMKSYMVVIPAVILAVIIEHFTDSRGSVALLLIASLGLAFSDKTLSKVLENKVIKVITVNSWLVFTCGSLAASYLYYLKTSVGIFLDKILSMRLMHNVRFMSWYPISLFGQEVIFTSDRTALATGARWAVLDDSYIIIPMRFGVIFAVFLYYQSRKLFMKYYNEQNYKMIIILFTVLVYLTIENHFARIVFLLPMGLTLFDSVGKKKR